MENLKKLGFIVVGVYLAIMLVSATFYVYNNYFKRPCPTDLVILEKSKIKEMWITNYVGESSNVTLPLFEPIEAGLTITNKPEVNSIDLLQTNKLNRLDIIANDLKSLMDEIQNRKNDETIRR